MRYMTMKDWKKREFSGSGWDNRTIKKLIAEGVIIGILFGDKSLVREDQKVTQLDSTATSLEDLIRESA